MVTKEQVLSAVCDVMGQSEAAIKGHVRDRKVVRARHMAMFLLADLCNVSSVFTGLFLNRDHSSVLHGRKNAEYLLGNDEEYREMHRHIVSRLAEMNKQQVAA